MLSDPLLLCGSFGDGDPVENVEVDHELLPWDELMDGLEDLPHM